MVKITLEGELVVMSAQEYEDAKQEEHSEAWEYGVRYATNHILNWMKGETHYQKDPENASAPTFLKEFEAGLKAYMEKHKESASE